MKIISSFFVVLLFICCSKKSSSPPANECTDVAKQPKAVSQKIVASQGVYSVTVTITENKREGIIFLNNAPVSANGGRINASNNYQLTFDAPKTATSVQFEYTCDGQKRVTIPL